MQLAWRRARLARDPRFDGRFFIAVVTTGIYCRPICPAPSPLERNVRYFATAAGAAAAGFRPCLRCHPEVAPGTPAWQGTSATVSRGLRLIDEHGLGRPAGRSVGVEPRHRPPTSAPAVRRAHRRITTRGARNAPPASRETTARRYLFAVCDDCSGGGVWQRQTVQRSDQEDLAAHADGHSPALHLGQTAGLCLRLWYRPPYDWPAMHRFLAARAIDGIESADGNACTRARSTWQEPWGCSRSATIPSIVVSTCTCRPTMRESSIACWRG